MSEENAVVKRTKSTNCAFCGKLIRRVDMYYRNGKYYCGKNCFKKMQEKIKKEKEEAAAAAAAE